MAQFGRALRSGRRGRKFKSCHLDQIPPYRLCGEAGFFCISVARLEKNGFAKQNCNLPVDGCKVRVRAGETVSPGKSCHLDHRQGLTHSGLGFVFVFNPCPEAVHLRYEQLQPQARPDPFRVRFCFCF